MSFDISTLITDRTALDVTRGTAKGQYKVSDLNRIGGAINYVAKRLRELGHDVNPSQKTNWKDTGWVNAGEEKQLLKDLEILRSEIAVFQSTPNVPSTMERLSYERANDIEKILLDLNELIDQTWMTTRRLNSPEFYAGSDPLPTGNTFKGRTWKEVNALELTWDDWNNATFFQILYEAFGLRTWMDLDALGLTWADWNRATFLTLSYEKI